MRTLAALSLAALAGCSTSDKLIIATLIQSPPPPGGLTGNQVTVAQVYLGETSVSSPSAGDVTPVSGAMVQLLDNGTAVPASFTESRPGYYQATGSFYTAGHTYRLVATVGSDQYWGEVASVPPPPTLTLPGTPSSGVYTYSNYSNTTQFPNPYPINRSCTGPFCDVAFFGVWSVSGTTFDSSATPNCTNVPQDLATLLQFAFLDDTSWRVNPFDVNKAVCFPQPGTYPGTYVVGLADLKKGTTSGNTSMASAAYAGASAAAGVVVQNP